MDVVGKKGVWVAKLNHFFSFFFFYLPTICERTCPAGVDPEVTLGVRSDRPPLKLELLHVVLLAEDRADLLGPLLTPGVA